MQVPPRYAVGCSARQQVWLWGSRTMHMHAHSLARVASSTPASPWGHRYTSELAASPVSSCRDLSLGLAQVHEYHSHHSCVQARRNYPAGQQRAEAGPRDSTLLKNINVVETPRTCRPGDTILLDSSVLEQGPVVLPWPLRLAGTGSSPEGVAIASSALTQPVLDVRYSPIRATAAVPA